MTDKRYLTEKQVAAITGDSLSKLRNDRFLGRGIPYVKRDRSVRYDQDDVIAHMDSRKVRVANA
jgi:predicted DNA-binding transcriptional regulator AlpA